MSTEDLFRAACSCVSPHTCGKFGQGCYDSGSAPRIAAAADGMPIGNGTAMPVLEKSTSQSLPLMAVSVERVRPTLGLPAGRGALSATAAWPLAVVLCVQAVLSFRLVRANTAFQDEALYLWAGHLEWAHWLSGTSVPLYPAYFSGAPVLYPPLGALADSVAGLAGARILSLCFMLGATILLWATATRLYGRRAAFFAVGLWAVLGSTLKLGAFATYDAMSLCLIALAVWILVHAGQRRDEMRWLAGAAIALLLANATTYASALFDPVVVGIAIIHAQAQGVVRKVAVSRGAALAAYVTAGAILLVMIGGGYYGTGIGQTTLARAPGTDAPLHVLADSWSWTAPIVVAAVAGVIVGLLAESQRHHTVLLAVLASAAFLVPLEQARIHTLTSLDKHLDFGAWFAAMTAGYAADQLLTWLRPRWLSLSATGMCAVALVLPVWQGAELSTAFFKWPTATKFDAVFGRVARAHPGRFLVESPSIPEYYLPIGKRWQLWSNTRSIMLPTGHSISAQVGGEGDPRVYARFIRRDYFSLVALNFLSTQSLDHYIAADLDANPSYRVVAHVPYGATYYTIWARIRARAGQQ